MRYREIQIPFFSLPRTQSLSPKDGGGGYLFWREKMSERSELFFPEEKVPPLPAIPQVRSLTIPESLT